MSVASPSPRSEPLLWLQLLALGLLPLEALLLLLLLGASDPGPLPVLERSLCWAIGVLAPGALLWRFPVDPWSLLVAKVPQRGRREIQQRLSALLPPPLLRLGSLVGFAILSLVLLCWCDDHAAFASAFSPVAESPRLVGLLLAAVLLAVLLWQGQQVVQALWLLSRSPDEVAATAPLSAAALDRERLSPGLPLLLLPPLRESFSQAPKAASAPFSASSKAVVGTPQPEAVSASGGADCSEAAVASAAADTSREAEAPPRKPQPVAEAQAESEDEAQAEAEPEVVAEAQTQVEAEAQAQPEVGVEAEVVIATEVDAQAEAEALTVAATEAPDHPSPATLVPASPGLESSSGNGSTTAEESAPSAPDPVQLPEGFTSPSAVAAAVAVEPEQPSEDEQGPALDQQIS